MPKLQRGDIISFKDGQMHTRQPTIFERVWFEFTSFLSSLLRVK